MGQRFSASFTRPNDTTAYTAGDLVANTTTAGSVAPLSWALPNGGDVRRVIVRTNNATITNGAFRLWLLDAAPTVANGDNGALGGAWAATVLATVDVTLTGSVAGSPGAGLGFATIDPGLLEVPRAVFGLLESRGAYTPAANEVFTVTLEVARP